MRGPKSPGGAQASRRHHRTWTVSALPDLDGVRLAGRPQPRNRTTGAPAVERIAAVRSDDLNAPTWPRVGGDPLAHRIHAGHRAPSAARGWSPGATTQAEVCAMPTSVPAVLAAWMQPFASFFTPAVWRHVLVLIAGSLLAPGRRTVTAALRVMGLDQGAGFALYHRVLSTGCWSSRAVAHRLLLL